MTKVSAPYLYRKRGVYYLQKRIPKPLIPQYGRSILQRSLRTTDRTEAVRLSSQIVAALHREWQERLFALPQDGSSVYEGLITGLKQEPSLSEAMHLYLQATGKERNQRFIASTERSVTEVVSLSGDKAISAYTRSDALKFRDALVSRGSSQATVKRNLSNVRAIWNYIAREHGIETVNPFANMNYGNAKAPVKRMPIPIEDIHKVQQLCLALDDDIRWIIAAISDSGMRLAEVIGLTASDVHLDEEVLFVRLSEHPWRRLKTAESQRDVPLVGATLWGLKRAVESSDGGLLFPRYCTPEGNKANYASSALNFGDIMGKSAPYLFQKRDVYYLQKRTPQQLVPTLGRTVIRKSLRTPCRATAIKTAIKTALKTASPILEALDREWHQALFTIPEGPCGCARTFIS